MAAELDVDLFVWSEDMTLRQMVEVFKHRLPQMIQTTSGYSDGSNINEIGCGEVRESRMIDRTKKNIYQKLFLARLVFRNYNLNVPFNHFR